METLRVYCKICNKGLMKPRLIIMDAYNQLQFEVSHFQETKHNDFGVELSEIDLTGDYLNEINKRQTTHKI